MDAAVFLATAKAAEDLIRSGEVAGRWADDSALTGYTIGGLAGHLVRAVLTLEDSLDHPSSGGESTDAAGYFTLVLGTHDPVSSGFHEQVRARGAAMAVDGPTALAEQLRAARLRLAERLPTVDPHTLVVVRDDIVLPVEAYVRTRLVELVLHLDDLAVSVQRDGADGVPPEAYADVAAVLARVAVERSGPRATIRSLARRERHPEAVRAL